MSTAAERAWANTIIRSLIYSFLDLPGGPVDMLLLNKESLYGALRARFRKFKHVHLTSFRSSCENRHRYQTCLSYVHELERAISGRADVFDSLDVYPNLRVIRDTSRQGGHHVIYLSGPQDPGHPPHAVIETTHLWEMSWPEPGSDDDIEEDEQISLVQMGVPRNILPSGWNVEYRARVGIDYRQRSAPEWSPRFCQDLDRMCQDGLGPFVDGAIITELTLGFPIDPSAIVRAMQALSARSSQLVPRFLNAAFRLHAVDDVTALVRACEGNRLERLRLGALSNPLHESMNLPGCLTLLDLLRSDNEAWQGCEDIKHQALRVKHDRLDQLSRVFYDTDDLRSAAKAICRRIGSHLSSDELSFASPRLPKLEAFEITLCWPIAPPVFHDAYICAEDDLEEDHMEDARQALWSLLRLNDAEVDALAAFGPNGYRCSFKLWHAIDIPASRGALFMQELGERLTRDIASRFEGRNRVNRDIAGSTPGTTRMAEASASPTSCEDSDEPIEAKNRYKACLSFVHELERDLINRADVFDSLDLYSNVRVIRDTSRQGGPHVIFLPDPHERNTSPRAIIETTDGWIIRWLIPGAETDDDDEENEDHDRIGLTADGLSRRLLPSSWDVEMRKRVQINYKQPSDPFFHPRICEGLERFIEQKVGPFDVEERIDTLVLALYLECAMVKAAMRCLRARDPDLIPRSLEASCRVHDIDDVEDIMRLADNPRLEHLRIKPLDPDTAAMLQSMNFPGCLSLLDLLASTPDEWQYSKDLKHLSLVVRHDRIDQLPRRFGNMFDFAYAAAAICRRDRNYLSEIPPSSSSPRLPRLESLELTLCWHIDPAVFHEVYVAEDDPLEQETLDSVRDPLWILAQLSDSEMASLAAFGPADCRYSFKFWQMANAPSSRGAMLMQGLEERLNRDVAKRILRRPHPHAELSRSAATEAVELPSNAHTSTVVGNDSADAMIPTGSLV